MYIHMMEFSTLDILKLGGKRKRRRAFNSGTFEYYVSATFKKNLFIWLRRLCCGSQDLWCTMWDLSLWWTNSVVAAHGIWDPSSLTRDRTHILCIARWILNYWIARRVLEVSLFDLLLFYLHIDDNFLDSQFCPTDLFMPMPTPKILKY